MTTEMAEACGSCCRYFLRNRKTNESFKCSCQRPFFSQTVARNNLPTDRDCWIEVPKRFVRHYSSLFGETVTFQGEDGQSYSCPLVGSDIAIVGYGFEWYEFASSHRICIGDQVVFTLMEGSRFLVQLYRAQVKVKVEVEVDVDVEQVEGAQEWLRAKASKRNSEAPSSEVVYVRRSEKVDKKKGVVGISSRSSPLGESTTVDDAENKEDMEISETSSSTSDSDWSLGGSHKKRNKNKGSELQDEDEEDDDSGATTSDDNMKEEEEEEVNNKRGFQSKAFPRKGRRGGGGGGGGGGGKERVRSPHLFVAPRGKRVSEWAEPGSTMRKTYVSKRGPITCADRDRVFEAAKACPITHNSYLKQLGYDSVYRALGLAIPAQWWRENMPQTDDSYKAALVDEEGKSWDVGIRGSEILWGKFSLDHYLEEDDVVVMELTDPRLESLKFLVHIFRAVDVKVTLTGKAGWAFHYTIVEGIKKQSQEARKQLLKGRERLKRRRARGSSHSTKIADSSTKTSRRRPTTTKRGRRQTKVHVEHDSDTSEDSLPLENTRGHNPTSSKIDKVSSTSKSDKSYKFGKPLPKGVKAELVEVKRECAREFNGLYPPKSAKVLPRKVKVETEV